LNRLPNPLGGGFSVRELLYRLDSRQAIPNIHEPLVLGSDHFRKLLFAPEYGQASVLGDFPGGANGDVIFGIDCERLHLSALFPTAYRIDEIHRSGCGHKQGNSEKKIAGANGCRWFLETR
jgi:hypothetical protein